jgi:hypothetical protein
MRVFRVRSGFGSFKSGVTAMAKTYHTNKQSKKKALLTPKEKKAKKLAKKHATDVVPLIHH